jgi:hypothetical protein
LLKITHTCGWFGWVWKRSIPKIMPSNEQHNAQPWKFEGPLFQTTPCRWRIEMIWHDVFLLMRMYFEYVSATSGEHRIWEVLSIQFRPTAIHSYRCVDLLSYFV